ncbi:LptA/OstA family protein [Opitutus sp. ER46]|uniref:LptA/OstA family protein n=1 Tax=Opitutus sp. ER46 TaxID=2161864 RepID=UPI000D2FD34C|nr:LptA/OstA family protein [Opitutus sp. ER46]PTX97714.1 hypothetical protein DB354_05385 [Opitutus sp. ER46]
MNRFLRASGLFISALLAGSVLRAADAPTTPTVIEADRSDMVSTEVETTFTFRQNVVVTATNMKLMCDQLVVVAPRTGDTKATFGTQEKFKSLVATGHVRILQNDREATCERAEVFPGDDKVVLTGNPRIRTLDGSYVADGPVMELHRGERRASIQGHTRITLPPLKDLGYDKAPEKKKAADTNNAGKAPTPQK